MKTRAKTYSQAFYASIIILTQLSLKTRADESSTKVIQLLADIAALHQATGEAISSYHITYEYKSELLEDAAAFADTMRDRSLQLRGKQPGTPIDPRTWIPRDYSCDVLGTPSKYMLSYTCLQFNKHDNLKVGMTRIQYRDGGQYVNCGETRGTPAALTFPTCNVPNFLDLLNLLPSRIPYLELPSSWGPGTANSNTVAGLFLRVLKEPTKYPITLHQEKDLVTFNILERFEGDPDGDGAKKWIIPLDTRKNFVPLGLAVRPGRLVNGEFRDHGYGNQLTYGGYLQSAPGIWLPTEIVGEVQRRLKSFVKPGEDVTWNKAALPLEVPMRLLRHTLKADKIELNDATGEPAVTTKQHASSADIARMAEQLRGQLKELK